MTNNSSELLVPRLHEVVGSVELGDGPLVLSKPFQEGEGNLAFPRALRPVDSPLGQSGLKIAPEVIDVEVVGHVIQGEVK